MSDGHVQLAALADEYFQEHLAYEPVSATMLGIPGHDDEVSDPSRACSERHAASLRAMASRLASIDKSTLSKTDRITHSILRLRLRDESEVEAAGLSEVSVSASVAGTLSMTLAEVPRVRLADRRQSEAYLARLAALGGYFDAVLQRHKEARDDGRYPTATGVRQAIRQLDSYLSTNLRDDPLLRPTPGEGVDADQWRARAEQIATDIVRPALARFRTGLADDLLPVGRDDDHIGACRVPGGSTGYDALARLYTTTQVPADQIHHAGLNLLAELRDEIGAAGAAALGVDDVGKVLRRLGDDPMLRLNTSREIVNYVTAAYHRAQQALPGWFKNYDLPPCSIQEMDPIQARGGIAAYYLWPSADGSRPGALWINTYEPAKRPRAGYEVLTFHEAVPGHHLQVAVSADLEQLPDFRRYRRSAAHSEGWGLYVEHLADEMGLYSTDVDRLGMLSSAAWRACRLVVDTGIHHFGWSRTRAVEFMRDNTALSSADIDNEIDRYIAAPAQALSYMIGRIRIDQLRSQARQQMGTAFDIAEFHHRLLSDGSVPLDTLDDLIADWIAESRPDTAAP